MKKLLFIFLTGLVTLINAEAQDQAIDTIKSTEDIKLDSEPEYPGGNEAFKSYIMRKLKNEKFTISQQIIINFTVEKDGTLSNPAFSEGTEEGTRDKLVKAIRKSKKWKPAMLNKKAVRVRYKLPVNIKIFR